MQKGGGEAGGILPLYEAKLIHQFDHRWATYEADGETARDVTLAEKQDPAYRPQPRYWVEAREVYLRIARMPSPLLRATRNMDAASAWPVLLAWAAGHAGNLGLTKQADQLLALVIHPDLDAKALPELPRQPQKAREWAGELEKEYPLDAEAFPAIQHLLNRWGPGFVEDATANVAGLVDTLLEVHSPRWLMGWRDICRSTDERTVIAGVIPRAGVGNNLPLMLFGDPPDKRTVRALLGNLDILVLDFVARHKVGGTHLNYFVYKQLPILPPDHYTEPDLTFILPRVLELTYTAHDLKPWAEDLGYSGPPFPFDPERRAVLRAELDAYYACLYGLNRDELRYILDPADVMGRITHPRPSGC